MPKFNGKQLGKYALTGASVLLVSDWVAPTIAGFGNFAGTALFAGLTVGSVLAAGVGVWVGEMASEKLF